MFAVFDNFGAAATATMDLELDAAPRSGPLLGTEHGRQRKELNGRSLKPRRKPTRINRKVQAVPTFNVTTTASIQSEESRPIIDFDSICAGMGDDVDAAPQPEISINMPVTPNNSMKIGRLRQTNTAHIDCIKLALKSRKGGDESPSKKAKVAPPVAARTPPRAAALKKTAPPLYARPTLIKSTAELATATQRLKKKPAPAPPAKKSKPAVAPPLQAQAPLAAAPGPAKVAPKPPAKKAKAKVAPPVPPKKQAKEAPSVAPKVAAKAAKVPPPKPESKPTLSKATVPLPGTATPAVVAKPVPPATLPKPGKQSAAAPEADAAVVAPEEPADAATAAPATPQKETSPEADDADAICPPTVSRALTLSVIDKELGQHLTDMVTMSAARIADEDALLKQSAYRSADGGGKSLLDLFSAAAGEAEAEASAGAEEGNDNKCDADLAEADGATLAAASADEAGPTGNLFTRTESDNDYIALGAPPSPPTAQEETEENEEASERVDSVPCLSAVTEVVDDIVAQLVEDAAATAATEADTHAEESVVAGEDAVADAAVDAAQVSEAPVETDAAAVECTAVVAPKAKLVEERARPFCASSAQPPVTSKRRPTNTGAPLHERLAVLQKVDKVRSTPAKNTIGEASVSTPCMKHLQSTKGAVGKLAARFENVSSPTKASVAETATPESSEEPLWKLALNKARQFHKQEEPSSPRRASNAQPSWKRDFEKVRKERKPVSQSKKDWQKAPKSSKENVMGSGVPGWKAEFERIKSKKRRSSIERGAKPFGQSTSPNKKPTNPSAAKFSSLVAATNASAATDNGGKPTWMKQALAARRRRNGGLY